MSRALVAAVLIPLLAGCTTSGRTPTSDVAEDGHRLVLRKPPGGSPRNPRAAPLVHENESGELLPADHGK